MIILTRLFVFLLFIYPLVKIMPIIESLQWWIEIILNTLSDIIIVSNLGVIIKKKSVFVYITLAFILLMVISQLITPPLPKEYNPYVPTYYYQSMITGVAFWIVGITGYKIFTPETNDFIFYLILFFTIIHIVGRLFNVDIISEEISYQIIPYLTMWLSAFSLLFPFKKRYVTLILCVLSIMISTKRGPIIAIFAGLVLVYIYQSLNGNLGNIVKGFMFIIFLYVCFVTFLDFYLSRLFDRLFNSEDLSNGREFLWGLIWLEIISEPPTKFIFGNGHEATHILTQEHAWTPIGAHNDFLDIFYNQGIVGLTIFTLLIICWVSIVIKAIKDGKNKYAVILIYLIVCYIFSSYYSSNFTRFSTTYFGFLFYYISGIVQYKNNNEIIGKNIRISKIHK